MAVYYKFKSAKDYDTVSFEGHFISVANLKEKIFEQTKLSRAPNTDILISNAQTNEEYTDEGFLVPRNTSVLVRRVPARHRAPVVAEVKQEKPSGGDADHVSPVKNRVGAPGPSYKHMPDESNDLDDFGVDLFAPQPQAPQVHQQSAIQDDEANRIKAFVDSSASEWQKQTQESFATGRGFGRGSQARGHGARGNNAGRMFEKKTPPHGYVCHRCGITGHYIQHCPTNGDPAYDMKKVKPPTGIPKTMLVANPDGSYALPTGEVAVLKPNEAIFEKEVTGLLSKRAMLENIPPELRCPLCRGVLKEAVLTSKCCFKSFCDRCIRQEIMTKGKCVCGASNVLADDLLPNMTLREAIDHFLETQVQTTMTTSSGNNAGSRLQVQDMESAPLPRAKAVSPSVSASLREPQADFPSPNTKEKLGGPKNQLQESNSGVENVDGTPESQVTTREPNVQDDGVSPQETARVEEEVQQRRQKAAAGLTTVTDAARGQAKVAKGKVKRKRHTPLGGDQQGFPPYRGENGYDEEMGGPGPSYNMQEERYCLQCGAYDHPVWLCPMNHMMGPMPYNNYPPHPDFHMQWGGMSQQQMMYQGYGNGFQAPYYGYGGGPEMMPFHGGMGHEPYEGDGFMNSYPREYVEPNPPAARHDASIMSREQFEARQAEMRRIREMEGMERYHERDSYPEGAAHDVAESNGNPKASKRYKQHGADESPDEIVERGQGSRASLSPARRTHHKSKPAEPSWSDRRPSPTYPSDGDSDVAPKRKRVDDRKREKSRR